MFTSRRSGYLPQVAVLGAGFFSASFFGVSFFVATTAHAHFILTSPPAAHEQGFLGDPQKAPPCGDDGSAVATGMSTDYKGGDVITITIDEKIFHPGHYRIALALNDISELPAEPPVTPNDTACGTVPIQNPPVFPVLADGVFLHDQPFAAPQSFDLTLPADVSCTNCTLQVIQFMSNHGLNNPGGCFYHHCATISVQGEAAGTSGAGESSDTGTMTTSATTATSMTTTASSQGETTSNDGTAGATGTATGDAPTSGAAATGDASSGAAVTASESATDGASNDSSGGCGCSGAGEGHGPATLALVLGLFGLGARRRSPGC